MIAVTYIYFFVCLLIMLFTIGYIVYQYYRRKTFKIRVVDFEALIKHQLNLIRQDLPVAKSHEGMLIERLAHVNQLTAFHAVLKEQVNDQALKTYKLAIESVIKKLVVIYEKRDDMQRAYLAYFISQHADGLWENPVIYRTLFRYLDQPNIYLRENVLKAFYQQQNPEWIARAFEVLSKQHLVHNQKLIQDGLLSYPYDKQTLIQVLINHYKSFNESVNLGVIGFVTYETDAYKDWFFELIQGSNLPLEIELKLCRYFKKHPDDRLKPYLFQSLKSHQVEKRIVAADVLASYCCDDVIQVLKAALNDPNWYVRRNASRSLLKTEVTMPDLLDVLTGKDRYAKEMLRYYLEREGG
ncbi:hypothetical protein GCM10012290_10620 [Halolactibacillus alkaliphilus]|uniref:HEAT repeat-containing PBS lyase n=1 Tax=Halolactibacillus alkaliphilus TaxID=442899 RepID=A0A511X291_9BACI|nr:HEAT repeat domain-containing protein [Halolactibacillus alkaliphilus]GEN57060.1 hypothetical protein HAL01_15240 [Halolactibacillus alkaliphilus]GGN68670.1 hypothetical protein GCM10012290_10620 [Halolactibacillus alkaliphilus]SFO86111.1 HEAT repeat-containing protein [Halolactibacillus alkaliphilus]